MTKKVKVSLEFDIEGVQNSYMSNGLTRDQAEKILKKFSEDEHIDYILGGAESEELSEDEEINLDEGSIEELIEEPVEEVEEVIEPEVVEDPKEEEPDVLIEEDEEVDLL